MGLRVRHEKDARRRRKATRAAQEGNRRRRRRVRRPRGRSRAPREMHPRAVPRRVGLPRGQEPQRRGGERHLLQGRRRRRRAHAARRLHQVTRHGRGTFRGDGSHQERPIRRRERRGLPREGCVPAVPTRSHRAD